MSRIPQLTRREFLQSAIAASAAASVPSLVPGEACGRDGAAAPSERLTLGVIGIGPRMTYDLGSVLPKNDVRCVAICDVQASRREAGCSPWATIGCTAGSIVRSKRT